MIKRAVRQDARKTAILFEDHDILVCYKPAGIAVQSARPSQADVESELRNYLRSDGIHVVHRLDQPVEGLIVFAKTKEAAARLGAQAQNGMMNKYYSALICGAMPQKEGVLIDDVIKRRDGVGEVVTGQRGNAARTDVKRAELSYRVTAYETDDDVSTVEICLKTGRFHQIRLQFAHAGHPLLGDYKYGGAEAAARAQKRGVQGIALCAGRLSFLHPRTGVEMDFTVTPNFLKD